MNNLDTLHYEENAGKKRMMIIERPKHFSDFIFIFTLGIINILAGVAAAIAPRTCIQLSSSRLLHNKIFSSPLNVTIDDLSPYNMYVYADLQFMTYSFQERIKAPINLKLTVDYFYKNAIIKTKTQHITYDSQYPNYPSKVSKPIRLFMNQVIQFDSISYSISYNEIPKEAQYLVTSAYRDDPTFSILKLIIAFILTFLLTILLFLYKNSFGIAFSEWRLEQKATFILALLSIFNSSPFLYYFYFNYPSSVLIFLIHSAKSIFESYLYIYSLIITETLRINYTNISNQKTLYYILFTIHYLVDIFHKINPKISLYTYSSDVSTSYNSFFLLEFFINFLYSLYFLFKVWLVLNNLDSRNHRKALIYLSVFFMFLVIAILAHESTSLFEFLEQGPMYYVMMTVFNVLIPIIMLILHMPLSKAQNDTMSKGPDQFTPVETEGKFVQFSIVD